MLTRKTLLYKSGVEYADYGLNHVEGCSHGCMYPCYAMMLKKRCGKVKTYQEWIQPRIVENALELLDKELPRLKDKIEYVFMCFSTDPFMYKQPEIEALSLNILARLAEDDVKAVLISKGVYPETLRDSKYHRQNEYGSTVVSLSDEFRRKYEPSAAPMEERIKGLRQLHDTGLKTWVSIEPYPTPNIVRQDLDDILEAVSFVDKIVFGKWNYNRNATSYKGYKDFYNAQAARVVEFCATENIDCHIKNGTITHDSTEDDIVETDRLEYCYI
jgi:DNA repair photolyase